MASFKSFLSHIALNEGNPLSRTLTLKKKGIHSAFVSPDRTNRSAQANADAAKHLEKRVRGAGYGFRKAEGEWDEGDGVGKEKSYQVIAREPGAKASGKFRKFVKGLGKELDQQAIIHNNPTGKTGGEGTAITTTNYTAPDGEKMRAGQKTKFGQMHYNTPNPYGRTKFKKGGSITYK